MSIFYSYIYIYIYIYICHSLNINVTYKDIDVHRIICLRKNDKRLHNIGNRQNNRFSSFAVIQMYYRDSWEHLLGRELNVPVTFLPVTPHYPSPPYDRVEMVKFESKIRSLQQPDECSQVRTVE